MCHSSKCCFRCCSNVTQYKQTLSAWLYDVALGAALSAQLSVSARLLLLGTLVQLSACGSRSQLGRRRAVAVLLALGEAFGVLLSLSARVSVRCFCSLLIIGRRCSMLLFPAPRFPFAAPRCSSLLVAVFRCSSLLFAPFAAPRCSSLLLASPCCRRRSSLLAAPLRCSLLFLAARRCSLLLLAALRCSSLLFTAPCSLLLAAPCCSSLLCAAPRCSSLLLSAPFCSSLLFGVTCIRNPQAFKRDRLFYSSFGFLFIAPFPTAMAIKIQALQREEEAALEKAKKILPRDADLPPQALRCECRWLVLLGGLCLCFFLFMCARPCACECICDVNNCSLYCSVSASKTYVCTGIWALTPRTLWAPM